MFIIVSKAVSVTTKLAIARVCICVYTSRFVHMCQCALVYVCVPSLVFMYTCVQQIFLICCIVIG